MHSYVVSNNTLLCSVCIKEKKLTKDKYKPIPQVIRHIHRSLIDQKYSKELCLVQLRNFESSLEYALERQKDDCRKKIESYFKQLHEIVEKAELSCYQTLENQHAGIKKKICEANRIDSIREKINKHQTKIDRFLCSSDEELLEKFKLIKRVVNHKNRYFKNMKFPEQVVRFKCKDSLVARIEDLVKNSVSFELKSTSSKDAKTEVKKCFSLKDKWFCITCLTQNSNRRNPIECKQ